jgi:hypothetical protein
MSQRHQTRRRRSYGRRQHELHERRDRLPTWQLDLEPILGPDEDVDEPTSGAGLLDMFGSGFRFAEGGR